MFIWQKCWQVKESVYPTGVLREMANLRTRFGAFGKENVRKERWFCWWRFPNALALDAALAAVCWQEAAARFCGARLGWEHGCLLAAAVWLGYVADRWLDGRSIGPGRAFSERHRLAIRWRRELFWTWGCVLCMSFGLAWASLGRIELLAGAVLALACAGNAALAQATKHRFVPSKEVRTAVLFAGGVFFFSFMNGHGGAVENILPCFVAFVALCFLNCGIIACWEREVDLRQGQSSLATRKEEDMNNLFRLGAAVLVTACLWQGAPFFLGVGSVALALVALDLSNVTVEDKRVLADLALLAPWPFIAS